MIICLFYNITFVRGFGKHFNGLDDGHIFGHGGKSHGDHGHDGYDKDGKFGHPMGHHNGYGTHGGDSGKNNLLFTNDVIHHGNGNVYANLDEKPNKLPNTLSVDDIHDKMNDAMNDAHNASIAGKEAERNAELLRASIAAERTRQKNEQIAQLKALDDEAARKEAERPEVLGKKTIPVATFTQESFPLYHHVRDLMAKIKGIQQAEMRVIQAQKTITRLDDITDLVRLNDVAVENPHAYHEFLNAGQARDKSLYIPVLDTGGKFYVSGSSSAHNLGTHDIPLKDKMFADGHSHFSDHGNMTDTDLERGGKAVGPRPKPKQIVPNASKNGEVLINGDPVSNLTDDQIAAAIEPATPIPPLNEPKFSTETTKTLTSTTLPHSTIIRMSTTKL
ncbi:hypothetical protein EDEG_00939 [Edhazardia aedis USNM 41457]|uniref:Uncharacterized protein n=1 Tax=Edhazardia aedis (strain USNM 41457) TaxID=1003232 RepID=J9DBQ1_EDHAE|nr:hypothetical protein EDEG_00939 [Edhazardia aedis USNM 41457]|eukprot:EJW04919.1 hypothetical protein EDEG_00939 [Edhazardia aedis USNM 41457]